MRIKLLKHLILIILLVISSGCGFKLRGSYKIPNYLKTIYLVQNNPYENFHRFLVFRLKKLNIKIVSAKQKNVPILEVSTPTTNEEALAVGSSGQVQRLRIITSLEYKFNLNNKNSKTETNTITRSREISITNNLLLSNNSEKQIVQNELFQEIANELIRQLCSRPSSKSI